MHELIKGSWVLSAFWNAPDFYAIDECTQRKSAMCVIILVVFPFSFSSGDGGRIRWALLNGGLKIARLCLLQARDVHAYCEETAEERRYFACSDWGSSLQIVGVNFQVLGLWRWHVGERAIARSRRKDC
jgi:hypothetical protein